MASKKESLSVTHPELAAQADGWDPTTATFGSHTKAAWKCELGHRWTASISNRSKGRGCPVCAGKQIIIGYNDLATTHPEIAKQADGWDPTTVVAGSNKKLPWTCGKNHKWATSVLSRTQGGRKKIGNGCAVCSGRKLLKGFNDLGTLNPDLASEALDWDPGEFLLGSVARKKWICKMNHTWSQTISQRSHNGLGCPVCNRKVLDVGVNDLATLYPTIAAQADGWDPRLVFSSSNKKLRWKCSDGHEWISAVNNRTTGGNGCPICSGHSVLAGFNDLKTTHPMISTEAFDWDPSTVTAGTNVKYEWQCVAGHSWMASPHNRALNGRGCPYCSNKKVLAGYNDLATTNPELAAQADGWDPTSLTAHSNKKVGWRCQFGHTWKSELASRSGGNQCPICSGHTVLSGFNDLRTTHPEIAIQADGWDPTTLSAGSNKKLKWVCQEGHRWSTMVNSRTAGRGCPTCSLSGFDPNKLGWLYFIDHDAIQMFQVGISNIPSTRLAQHSKRGWEVIEVRGPMEGHLAQQLETAILHAIERRGAVLGHKAQIEKFDGYSEAWTKDSLAVTSFKQILDWVYEDDK